MKEVVLDNRGPDRRKEQRRKFNWSVDNERRSGLDRRLGERRKNPAASQG